MRGWRRRVFGGLALAAALGLGASAVTPAEGMVDLDQGWDAKAIETWVTANQGSRLLPLAWFRALEQPDRVGMFLDPAHMASFRYLAGRDGLPLGFTIDAQDDRAFTDTKRRWSERQGAHTPWVGMTCAACHTNDVQLAGRTMRVYGGSTLADFQGFLAALNRALAATAQDDARFARFAERVLGPNPAPAAAARLREELGKTVTYQQRLARMNATDAAYGYGRLDAIGHINNKIAYIVQPSAKGNPPDAPVSYPFLWNVPQQSRVEWNGSVAAIPLPTLAPMDLGAVGRNVGEVIGVFGEVVPPSGARSERFVSSVRVRNLIALEQQLHSLRPPRWPREIAPIDAALAQEGRALYGQYCADCHVELPRKDLKTRVWRDGKPIDRMSPLGAAADGEALGTDPWMACNAALQPMETGLLEGRRIAGKGPTFGATAASPDVLTHVVKAAMRTDAPALAGVALQSAAGIRVRPEPLPHRRVGGGGLTPQAVPLPDPYAERRARCEAAIREGKTPTLAYKARPLTGAWATGPFLHNGSVPTLYDLLLPPDQRPKTFALGSRELDPVKLGFVTTPGPDNPFVFRVNDAQGRPIPGNDNGGHDYGASKMDERQRRALVEYLKIVGEDEAPAGVSRGHSR